MNSVSAFVPQFISARREEQNTNIYLHSPCKIQSLNDAHGQSILTHTRGFVGIQSWRDVHYTIFFQFVRRQMIIKTWISL